MCECASNINKQETNKKNINKSVTWLWKYTKHDLHTMQYFELKFIWLKCGNDYTWKDICDIQ